MRKKKTYKTRISLQLLRSGTSLSLLDFRSLQTKSIFKGLNAIFSNYKLLSRGQVLHSEEGTTEIPALSNLNISKAVVPFKLGKADKSLASERILPTKHKSHKRQRHEKTSFFG